MKIWIAAIAGALLGAGVTVALMSHGKGSLGGVLGSGGAEQGEGAAAGAAGSPGGAGGVGAGANDRAVEAQGGAAGASLQQRERTLREVSGLLSPTLMAEVRRIAGERDELEEELLNAKEQLRQALDPDRKVRPYALTAAERRSMAKRCMIAWDMPSPGGRSHMNLEDAKRLGLDEGGRLQVEEVLGENDQWLEKHVARLYAEVIGDDKAGGDLSVESKWREIEDKTPREELMRVFQMLSAEKASASGLPGSAASGAAPVPSGELPSGSVAERLFRILLVNGDRVERQIGARIGDELARRYRDLHNGFSGRWTSTYGCPQGAAETGAAQ